MGEIEKGRFPSRNPYVIAALPRQLQVKGSGLKSGNTTVAVVA